MNPNAVAPFSSSGTERFNENVRINVDGADRSTGNRWLRMIWALFNSLMRLKISDRRLVCPLSEGTWVDTSGVQTETRWPVRLPRNHQSHETNNLFCSVYRPSRRPPRHHRHQKYDGHDRHSLPTCESPNFATCLPFAARLLIMQLVHTLHVCPVRSWFPPWAPKPPTSLIFLFWTWEIYF